MKKKTLKTHSTYSNYSPAHLRTCCTRFLFKTLYSHGASLPRSVNGFQQTQYPNCLGSQTKCLIPQVSTITCSNVSHLTLSQARRAKKATESNPLSAASIPCPFCCCLCRHGWDKPATCASTAENTPHPCITPLLSGGINHQQAHLSLKNNQ